MILSKQQLNAALFASPDISRYLGNIAVDPDGAVYATNGHVLVKVTRTEGARNPADYPTAALALPDTAKSPTARIYIPAATALAAAKLIPKKARLPILDNVWVAVTDTTLYIGATDLETPHLLTVARGGDITFPDCEPLIPKAGQKSSGQPFGVNAEYLALVAKYRLQWGDDPAIRLSPGKDPAAPFTFDWSDTASGQAALVVVMPMRLK